METYDTAILNVINYVEARFEEEVSLEELADEAAFSKYHFTRIFKALTKETVYEYVRKRRLTLAAKKLIDSNIPLIEIALNYGYGSQEAFSRAFKSYMGISPLQYRKKGIHYINLYKEVLSEDILLTKKAMLRHKSKIVHMPGFWIAGIPIESNVNNHAIQKLWNVFNDQLTEQSINHEKAKCYGYESINKNNEHYYIAAIEMDRINDVPVSWVRKYIPPNKYVVFYLDNIIENIPFAIEEIYKYELTRLNVKPALDFSIEVYAENFIANERSYLLEFVIPIE